MILYQKCYLFLISGSVEKILSREIKLVRNLRKIPENIWANSMKTREKMAPNVCRIIWRPHFGGDRKNGHE